MIAINRKMLSSAEDLPEENDTSLGSTDLLTQPSMQIKSGQVKLASMKAGDRPQADLSQQRTDEEQALLRSLYDFPKTSTTGYQPGCHTLLLPDCLIEFLTSEAGQEGIDGRSLLLAAFNVLLYRYTRQEAIHLNFTTQASGTPSLFTTEIGTRFSEDLTIRELIGYTSVALKGVPLQGTSKALQDRLLVHSQPASNATLPIRLTCLESLARVSQAQWLTSLQAQASEWGDNPDLHLLIVQQEQGIVVTLQYNTHLFKSETIQRFCGHFQKLLEGIVRDRNCLITELPLVTSAEEQQLLVEWKSPLTVYPPIAIPQLIEQHAVHQPDAIAITFKDQSLTYAALNQRANQLAHYLIQLGIGAEDRVAVAVEPSLDIAIVLLGVLKAGAVYVPLDPTYPLDRLTVILEDTQPKALLTHAHLVKNLPAIAGHTLCLDRDETTLATFPGHNPAITPDLDQTAYIVYTSGTTGKPKGVMASHRNLVNYIRVAQDKYRFDRDMVMPAIARFTFSITFFELLSPLVAGGRLVILERDHILDFKRMTQTLEEVNVIHASPSLLRKLLAYIQDNGLDIRRFNQLKHVSSGGDLVAADLLEAMKRVFQNAEVFVIYGCSEVSCMGCTYPALREQTVTKTWVGKPFDNVSVRLYDSHQNLVPIGVMGEIYFGGAGITKGYLNRAELTQEKFVEIDGQRFYRTGDLGRFNANGDLEILGRRDFQIQLRGIRIEPGEIEVTLRQFPGVREAVVVLRELWHGEENLVAYVVLDQEKQPTIEEIRRFLQTKLPDYMVPAAFEVLDAMPVNANQKIDRRALPAPSLVLPGSGSTGVAPRTPLEKVLADIWANTLGLEQVGIEDDFFAIGGHSLLAAQVIYRLQAALKLDISISRLFELPTIAALAEYLTPLYESDTPSAALEPILPISRETTLPLSFSQEQLWFLSQMEGGGVAYNIPLAFELTGTLHIPALEQSLTEILRRHEALRTTFPVVDGSPVQRILPPRPFHLPVVDLRSLPAGDRRAEVDRLATAEAQRPFNLAGDLLLRGQLLQLEADACVLLLTMHHIASDGWSLALLRKELAVLYPTFLQGATSPLEPLPVQYADFAHWQQHWLEGDFVEQQLAYWKQQLAGAPPLLELPADHSRPAVQSFRGGTESCLLDAELTHQLKQLSQRTGTTLYMTLLAAFSTLLSRYSGHQDIVIGSPVANRKRSEIESMIGFFINLLGLRVDLTGNPTFLELLGRVKQVALDAYANQDVPFAQVVEALQPERNLSYSPVFQVLLILQNMPAESLNLPGLDVSPLRVDHGTSKYDLTLMVEETDAGLVADFEYNGDLFERETIIRMIGHFQVLLRAIASHPEHPIADLPLLTEAERHQLLVQWNDTEMPYPPESCIHQLFESQVERTPDAIALVFEEQPLTYRELNQRANQLAHYLRSIGVGPESLVGICLERSLEMVVGLLGVLKAGGSYVPLDPAYPRDRLALMIEDSQLPLLLTQTTLCHQFLEQNVRIVCIDADWEAIAQQPNPNPNSGVGSDNLAYTIYTSGSTGKPKGVQLCHRTVVNFLNSMRHQPGLTAEDVLLAVTTISFDIAVLELYLPLMVGARAVIASREVASDAARLSALLEQSRATLLQATPATWRMLISGGWSGDRNLKMLCGGEALPRDLADQLLARGGSLWNMYGPTETTVWSATCQVNPGTGAVPVAGPIANTQIYVLEELPQGAVRPVPVGIPGEVHIGGDGLARGYLNRPELTAQRFIPDPFTHKPGARLYKTGDLARFRPDGTLEFLGRIDNQVKLRGFRIELGEIESLLERHPGIKQAVAVVREDVPGDQRLVAYLTVKNDAPPTATELRQFLKQQLPAYMVPAGFVVLERFPLTPNGKVDRKALPVPDLSLSGDDQSPCAAPRNELERQLVALWEEALRVKPVSIHDDFFELGGHSLLAVRMWAQVEQLVGRSLPLSTLVSAPTIAQLAETLAPASSSAQPANRKSIVRLKPGQGKPPLFLIHDGDGETLLYRTLANRLDPAIPVYGVQPYHCEQHPILHTRIADMVSYYIEQIRQVQPAGPYFLGGLCSGGIITFEIARQLQIQGHSIGMVAILDAADVKAAMRPGYIAGERLDSFSRVFRDSNHLKAHQRGLYILNQTVRKMTNLLTYEIQHQFEAVHNQLRLQLFRYCLDRGLPMPAFLQNIPVRPVLGKAQREYAPDRVFEGEILLFRATQKSPIFDGTAIDDTPFTEMFSDPLLGWGPRVTGGVQAHDVPGGHSSMLQEPNVQHVAAIMQAYIDRALVGSGG